MKDFKDNIIQGIKSGEIRPESRMRFLAHDYFFWILTGISVVLGGVATASIIYKVVVEQVRPLRGIGGAEAVPVFFQTAPYIWILVLLVLVLAAWFNYKKTSKSYRRHNGLIIAGVVILSLLFGIGLFAAGAGAKVDDQMRKRVPVFKKEMERREKIRDRFIQERRERLQNRTDQNRPPRPYPFAPQERVR